VRRLAVIIGLGRSGVACARVLHAEGYRVRVVDRADTPHQHQFAEQLPRGVDVVLGPYAADVAAHAALVCPAPAVLGDAPELIWARNHDIPVRSEIDMVFERCPAPIIGITGTNGKTTTTALTGAMLVCGGATVHVGGNIGVTMLDRLDGVRSEDWVVLELSSFQIASAARPRCHIAAVLNLTPDHLDWHRSIEAYTAAKRRLVEEIDPGGVVVLNEADPVTRAMATRSRADVRWFGRVLPPGADGAWVENGWVVASDHGVRGRVLPASEIPLIGEHNVLNVLAAIAVARAAGVATSDLARAVREFHPVAHRLETVLERDGILWVNDSKATNVESATVALRAFGTRPIVWIGGGRAKGGGPEALAAEVAAHARHAIVYGSTAAPLDEALAAVGFAARTVAGTLQEAVAAARRIAQAGDVVLLAPGYTSWDQFASFEERGTMFTDLVRNPQPATP
jgi:UDP-N-acetylmuramoylalanine--D-glutamate ligase